MLHALTPDENEQLLPSVIASQPASQRDANQNAPMSESKIAHELNRVCEKIRDTILAYSYYLESEEKLIGVPTISAAYIFNQALKDKIDFFRDMLQDLQKMITQENQLTIEILSDYENDLAQAEKALASNLQRAAKAQIKEYISDTTLWSTQVNQSVGGKKVISATGKVVRVPNGIEKMMRVMLPKFTASDKDEHSFFKASMLDVGAVVRTSVGSSVACLAHMNACGDIAAERLNRKKNDKTSAVVELYKILKVEQNQLRDPMFLCDFIQAIKKQHDTLKNEVFPAVVEKNSPRHR